MSLFVCDECGVIENTALCGWKGYWGRDDGKALCSQCNPDMGKWHGLFPRKQWEGGKVGERTVVNRD